MIATITERGGLFYIMVNGKELIYFGTLRAAESYARGFNQRGRKK